MVCSPAALSSRSIIAGVALAVYRRATPITSTAVVLGMFEPATGRLPPGPVVPQRVAHFRVEETEEEGHQEPLNQKTSSLINEFSYRCQLFHSASQSFYRRHAITQSHFTLLLTNCPYISVQTAEASVLPSPWVRLLLIRSRASPTEPTFQTEMTQKDL